MFNKNDNIANERTIYKAKPNMILGCKKAIYGVILLIIVLLISGSVIQFIGEMQVYLISYIKLSLTRYAAIGLFIIILCIILYIIWQIIGWYAKEYILTDSKIVVKSGVLLTRRNYMPYSTIQDINTSQSIFARLFNVGSISIFNAYDNNQISLENISNPSEVENIIFSKISNRHSSPVIDNPLRYEKKSYDYYPEEEFEKYPHYEYEPYIEKHNDDYKFQYNSDFTGNHVDESYYDEVRNNYSYVDEDYYQNDETELYYNDADEQDFGLEQDDVDETIKETSETVIKRHFDKFKK